MFNPTKLVTVLSEETATDATKLTVLPTESAIGDGETVVDHLKGGNPAPYDHLRSKIVHRELALAFEHKMRQLNKMKNLFSRAV